MRIAISTQNAKEVIDITQQVEQVLPAGDGLANIHLLHTTAAITTADLDPGTDLDLLDFLDATIPALKWRHPHDPAHAPDHLLASIIGPDVSLPFQQGKLLLGRWQRVVLVELDGPWERQVEVTVVGDAGGRLQ